MVVIVYVDGLTEPFNPGGIASYGFVVYRNGVKIFEKAEVIGEGSSMSNNVAEYSALCEALKFLSLNNTRNEEIIVKSDSQLLVNQMNGWWGCRGGLYAPKYHEALKLAEGFNKLTFKWVPREQNSEADGLSRRAYEEYCKSKGIEPKYHDQARLKPNQYRKETCMNCRWVRFSGPHIGCFKNGEYQKWLPRRFALYNRCSDYKAKGQGG